MPSFAENTRRADYVPGDAPRELARLEQQARFFHDMTRDVLVRAGIGRGMNVLELGCGVGDVTMIASDLIGRSGRILSIDRSANAIAIAQRRLLAAGRDHAGFRQVAIEEFDSFGEFDAVIGRFILVHLPDPVAALARIAERTKRETIVAFCELDVGMTMTTTDTPLFNQANGWIGAVLSRSGGKANMGAALYSTFRSAGLAPKLSAYQHVGSREEVEGLEFLAETVRTIVPFLEKLGIATAAEIDIDTLYDRLVDEAVRTDPCIFFPRFVGAWARV